METRRTLPRQPRTVIRGLRKGSRPVLPACWAPAPCGAEPRPGTPAACQTRAQPHPGGGTGHTNSQEERAGGFGRDWNVRHPLYHRANWSEPGSRQGHIRCGEAEAADAASAPHPGWRLYPAGPGCNGALPCRKALWALLASIPGSPPHSASLPTTGTSVQPHTPQGQPQGPRQTPEFSYSCLGQRTELSVRGPGDGPSTQLPESSGSPLVDGAVGPTGS